MSVKNRLMSIIAAIVFVTGISVSKADAMCSTVGFIAQALATPCWSCIFPISMFGKTIVSDYDTDIVSPAVGNVVRAFCSCEYPVPPFIRFGIPIGFFEPVGLLEVVREPYCFEALGTTISGGVPSSNNTQTGSPSAQNAFYQAHYYRFPIYYLLDLVTDSLCFEWTNADVIYITEVDPTWNDDVLAAWEFPEAALFTDPLVQASCVADCIASSTTGPLDAMFWCAGCWGSMYPFTGTTTSVGQGDVGVSALIGTRLYTKMFRYGLEFWTSQQYYLCYTVPTGFMVKSQYKFTQIAPLPQISYPCCHATGRSPTIWGMAKSYPMGENFVYVMWRLRRCCLL